MENRGGMSVSTAHEHLSPPFLSHPHPSSPALLFPDRGRQDSLRQRICNMADWLNLECSFANFYGPRFLLSAVNLPYCDLQWVYVPSSRNIRAPVCVYTCVCVCVRASVCVAYHDDR